ncbi:conserved Plasmodium protein, unknown function [Plasmodium gallinaceum]|uniref:RGS domain-containing protein n=1 Tax=Plasmodium gallinaceum TaxID=5849 RepID=A0A1J1GLC5_PLAGA|nr:conserved Plasmodium protein, unknown function [Plasmodium gallinaceum]CRG93005.1 conserved Plasmodium protein, unknown function [Plasmodium gallinaceum]
MILKLLLNHTKITAFKRSGAFNSNNIHKRHIEKKYFSSINKYQVKQNKKNNYEKENFIQLKNSDSSSKFEKNGIMKINNWPKKKISKKKNELYILLNKKDNKNVNFHELNIIITKKINNMQNINEIYKYIYYNKDILVPINYVVCIYKIYKLIKNNNYKIINYNIYINNNIMNISNEELNNIANVNELSDYNELYVNINKKKNVNKKRENDKEHINVYGTKRNMYNNNYSINGSVLDYNNDILQYVLEKINKNYFIKKLTYRHLSNLLFSLVNLKYYNIITYLLYIKYINNMYVYLSSQSISNIIYSYSIICNFYAIDFTVNYKNYIYKYYYLDNKLKENLKKDYLNFMFLLLSRYMCIYVVKYFNSNFCSQYDLNSFYKGILSNFEELNEKEKKNKINEEMKYENKMILQEFFVFLWSISKIKINNIYIDLLYYIIYKNRKYIYMKLNEKDICNLIQSLSIYYPYKKLSENKKSDLKYKVSLKKDEYFIFDYDEFLKNTLLLTLIHLKKYNYHHYSIIFKSIQIFQNFLLIDDEKNNLHFFNYSDEYNFLDFKKERDKKKEEIYEIIHKNNIIKYNKEVNNSKLNLLDNNNSKTSLDNLEFFSKKIINKNDKFKKESHILNVKEDSLKSNNIYSIRNILKKLTTVIIENLIAKIKNENNNIYNGNNCSKFSSSLNLQHLSIYLYNLSHMNIFFINNDLKLELFNLIISVLQKKVNFVFTFDKKNINLKMIDIFLQNNYDNIVCLSNINYSLNKNNIVNEYLILCSSMYFYKLYHLFYKIYKYTSNKIYFFNYLEKINERILSIFNWTFSHTNISYIPLFSLINYNYLYILYKKESQNIFLFLKKILLPITLYNNITINQLRLILKLLINYYICVLSKNIDKSYDNHEDILTCLFSLSLIITNVLHNLSKKYDIDKNNLKIDYEKYDYINFYINITVDILKSYFYKLYCVNSSIIQKYFLMEINEDLMMKFYTLYLFLKFNIHKKIIYNRNFIKKFLNNVLLDKNEFFDQENLLSHLSEPTKSYETITFEINENNFLSEENNVKIKEKNIEKNDKIINEKSEEKRNFNLLNSQKIHEMDESIFSIYVNNIQNKNYNPNENFEIFYLLQENLHFSELKINKNNLMFLKKNNITLNMFDGINKEIKQIEEKIFLIFKQTKSSKSHMKLYEYIKFILQKKNGNITSNIKNEYIINKDNFNFIVDIYDENTNTIFEIDGISHYTKQYLLNKTNKPFNFFYNYKSYYIFKHLLLSKYYNIIHLPLYDNKLCKKIIYNYYNNNIIL